MTTPQEKALWRSVVRRTGRAPCRVGYWLRRHWRTERLGPARLGRRLGLDREGLSMLCLCLTPSEGKFREDLTVICARTGASEEVLAGILRQEQALARWEEEAGAEQGWLMAASDAPPEEDEEEDPDEP
jgi:hypothetical protein